jgi:hypothetical protein
MHSCLRSEIIRSLTCQIQKEPWQRLYRKKETGPIVTGWSQRLRHYSLATNARPGLIDHLLWLNSLGEHVKKASTPQEYCKIAKAVLKWGGVTRGNLAKLDKVICSVVQSAIQGQQVKSAPMNSGWTKVAAVFAQFKSTHPQVIWDSRVSLSICTRLGSIAKSKGLNKGQLQSLFSDNLGWVRGRGGNRPKLQSQAVNWFPNRYGKWAAHFEGGRIAQEIAQVLNADKQTFGSPCTALDQSDILSLKEKDAFPKEWTPWLVACVLFMDGQ